MATQIQMLSALRRLLELDGFDCQSDTRIDAVPVPLLVNRNGQRVAVGMKSCLVDDQQHSLDRLENSGISVVMLNDYVLRQNLPDEHQLVRSYFA